MSPGLVRIQKANASDGSEKNDEIDHRFQAEMQQKWRAAKRRADRRFQHKNVECAENGSDQAAAQRTALEGVEPGARAARDGEIAIDRSGKSADQREPDNDRKGDARALIDGHAAGQTFGSDFGSPPAAGEGR
jgi:hypothetical protein